MLGSWKLANIRETGLPVEVSDAFNKVFKDFTGAKIRPALYVGEQLLDGTNYMIICTSTPSVSHAEMRLVKVIIKVKNDEPSILLIEPFV